MQSCHEILSINEKCLGTLCLAHSPTVCNILSHTAHPIGAFLSVIVITSVTFPTLIYSGSN